MVKRVPGGGLGEAGLNAVAVEKDDRRVMIVCGAMFPGDHVQDVAVAIPGPRSMREAGNPDPLLLTRDPEDHVGALPLPLRAFPAPGPGSRPRVRRIGRTSTAAALA